MGNFSKEELAELVASAVTQALAERRKEIQCHPCMCSDNDAWEKHRQDHEVIERISKFLDRIENAKWAIGIAILLSMLGGVGAALWIGVKACVKGE